MRKYIQAHEEHAITPLTISSMHHGWSSKILIKLLDGQRVGVNTFCSHQNKGLVFYTDGEAWDKGSDYLIGKIQLRPKFVKLVKDRSEALANELLKIIRKSESYDFSEWTNSQLTHYLSKTYKLTNDLSAYGYIPVLSDHLFNKYTHLLKKIIKQAIYKKGIKLSIPETFNTLTSPIKPIYSRQAHIDFLKMVSGSKGKLLNQDKKKIVNFYQKWHWVSYGHLGPKVTLEETVANLKQALKNRKVSKRELKELLNCRQNLIKKQHQLFKKLGLNQQEKYLFKVAQLFTYLKGLRMEIYYGMFYHWGRILKEMSRREKVPQKLLYYCSIKELSNWLKDKRAVSVKTLKQRAKYCVWIAKTETEQDVLVGARAKAYLKKHAKSKKEKIKDVLVIHGNVASVGYAKGRVKIVNKASEIKKVNKGDILVSIVTNPALLPAMKKAAAFVTDVGGINSHAAIVAREFKKPCIIGTKIATKVLKDGDLIELDTRRGDIKKVK